MLARQIFFTLHLDQAACRALEFEDETFAAVQLGRRGCRGHDELDAPIVELIDERDDPLGVEGFFPCPKPLYATTTSDTLVPVPDFVLYQDQAMELDILSDN